MLQEAGFLNTMSSTMFPGTDPLQNAFVGALFNEWATNKDRIVALDYFDLYDLPTCDASGAAAANCMWGIYSKDGTLKDAATWNTLTTQMTKVTSQ